MIVERDAPGGAAIDEGRRGFFAAVLAGAFAIGLAGQAGAQSGGTGSAVTDTDLLTLSLNMEYLVGELCSYGVYSGSLPADALTGSGTQGVTLGARPVRFQSGSVRRCLDEIAVDDYFHILFLRDTLRANVVAQPQINLGGGTDGPFTVLARAGGVVAPGDSFDPYASDANFLLAAMVLKDMMVSFYAGLAPLYTNPILLNVAIGRLGGHAYNAGMIRSTLYRLGAANPAVRQSAGGFATAVAGYSTSATASQGIGPDQVNGQAVANILPGDRNAMVQARTAAQTLNVAFLNRAATTLGGFFPAGLNANIRISAAL
ncbi:hypothetical protein GCM10011380_30300 [Sphingomonas metalli]|uniref:Ferritin-like domain-containing protein n=1 Tax=Sphingomonas metalli TaxID=1779358 RepID=A0A916TBP2_9SPHN|nr:ferritin-like domain-containing protein [Sphingomonas metalli]GGB38802.1 hypothetical protein GCM10011380_30300 [Sphingomonas metalli]